MIITFPHMGNTYIPAKAMLDDIGVKYIIPPFNNARSLEVGMKHAPEMACLPLKINLGNFIEAHKSGADTILIAGGYGPCRFGYYAQMHREILKDLGLYMEVITLESNGKSFKTLIESIKMINGRVNPYKILKILKNTSDVAFMVDELEKLTFKIRPREILKGSTDKIYKTFQKSVLNVEGSENIKKHIKRAREELLSVEIDNKFRPLRVGIVGEIYTSIDSFANHNIEAKLGHEGVEVSRQVTLSNWISDHIIKKALHINSGGRFKREAKPYLGAMIGGHTQETLGNTVIYAKEGFNGIIQIFPLACMPEIVSKSILPSIERDFNIPVLNIIIDEMTGEAGYITRVEAFVDLLARRKELDEIERDRLLSWN